MIARTRLIGVALLLASCTGPAPQPAPAPTPTPSVSALPRLGCHDALSGDEGPSPDLEVLLDAAALPTGRVLQANDHGDGWLFAKVGLFVRPHLRVELSVESGTQANVEYGPGDPAQRIVLEQCTEQTGRWIVYTGGYYVRTPQCVPIILRANGNEASVRIAVGSPC